MCRSFLVLSLALLGSPIAAQAPRDTLEWSTSYAGRPSGRLRKWVERDGTVGAFFEYNDRGRGPRTTTRIVLDSRGWPASITVDGYDYRKNPVGIRWGAPEGRPAVAFHLNGPESYLMLPLLARVLANGAGGTVPVALGNDGDPPAASLRKVQSLRVRSDAGQEQDVSLVAFSWLNGVRGRIWLDAQGEFFGAVGFLGVVRTGWQAALPGMIEVEEHLAAEKMAVTAADMLRAPSRDMAVTGVSLVDVRDGTVTAHSTILLRDSLIVAVGPDGSLTVPPGAHLVDGAGKWAMPGLWEMHGHLGAANDSYSRSRMAIGILSSRDLVGTLAAVHSIHKRRAAIEAGREVGLTLIISGFIDGPAENTGPTSVLVETEDSARKAVRGYAALGYDQIKTYSSLNPKLLPIIVDEARKHGMRVSGHIPAFMTAEQAVRAGMSEVNHANMLMLNFFGDTIDTRGTDRFYVPMEQWPQVDVKSERVQSFIRLLREHHVVLDPTLCIFKAQWGVEGGFPPRSGYTMEHHRKGYQRMEELVMEIHRGGVRMVAGTDNACMVQDELGIYAAAGVPVRDLLRMATLGAAEVTGRASRLGTIEPGKVADFILLDADPTLDIQNTRKVSLVVKRGIPLSRSRLMGGTDWP